MGGNINRNIAWLCFLSLVFLPFAGSSLCPHVLVFFLPLYSFQNDSGSDQCVSTNRWRLWQLERDPSGGCRHPKCLWRSIETWWDHSDGSLDEGTTGADRSVLWTRRFRYPRAGGEDCSAATSSARNFGNRQDEENSTGLRTRWYARFSRFQNQMFCSDVQPAAKSDGWDTEPFELVEKDGKLFGRGSSDDKGPVLCWVHAIRAAQKNNIELPVNIKFCFEAMEESGSVGLPELLVREKDRFLSGVDFVCISDSYWLGTKKPCLTYGLRGICSFFVEVTGIKQDLHSGVFGGVIHEPLQDLMHVMAQLTTVDNRIKIPGDYCLSDNARNKKSLTTRRTDKTDKRLLKIKQSDPGLSLKLLSLFQVSTIKLHHFLLLKRRLMMTLNSM